MLSLFGVEEFADFSSNSRNTLRGVINPENTQEGFDEEGRSYYLNALLNSNKDIDNRVLNSIDLYDENIKEYVKHINRNREEKIKLKYFQYLSVLFTEIFLDYYFNQRDDFLADLNSFVEEKNREISSDKYKYSSFKEDDLNKLAFYMATGSGKTLIMHINYLQFKEYNNEEVNNTILITPNSGLTEQHLEELELSNIDAAYLHDSREYHLMDNIHVIEITKLTQDKTGEGESIEISSFEGNNLIFVDEGHKGSGGDVWKSNREALAEEGFMFEYSATFGQAVSSSDIDKSERWSNEGEYYSERIDNLDIDENIKEDIFRVNKSKSYINMSFYELEKKLDNYNLSQDKKARIKNMYDNLLEEYSKAIIFDYSYKYFYNDGYGKDYDILNLKEGMLEEYDEKFLLANLMAFYEQKKFFANNKDAAMNDYNIENPLLMFVGHTVTATGNLRKRSASDIEFLIEFLNNFLQDRTRFTSYITEIMRGNSGFISSEDEKDIFSSKFDYLENLNLSSEEVYHDIKETIFHSSSYSSGIKLFDIKNGEGEIGIKVNGDEDYFGLVNIGDVSSLKNKLEDNDFIVEDDEFKDSMFSDINREDSNVNILIGSKKFTEGWNSYRVSSIGLLNVGRTEGSQIIQLFGRGVRLRGYNKSLKRSECFQNVNHPDYIHLLETLNVFGIKADYMNKFRDYLEDEGIQTRQKEVVNCKVREDENLLEENLLTLKVDKSYSFKNEEIIELELDENCMVEVDLRPKAEILSSRSDEYVASEDRLGKTIDSKYLDMLDWDEIYLSAVDYKREKGYSNLHIKKNVLKNVIYENYYSLICEPNVIEMDRFEDIFKLQDIVENVLKKYIRKYYRRNRIRYEDKKLMYKPLTKEDEDHFISYRFKIDKSKEDLIELIRKLRSNGDLFNHNIEQYDEIKNVYFDRHLFQPLLYQAEDKEYQVTPQGLNEGERDFVELLKEYFKEDDNDGLVEENEIYLVRNFERRGISFFEANNFYPDFILWIKPLDKDIQYINFFDPKGLIEVPPEHVKIKLYETIKDKEKLLSNNSKSKMEVKLNSFIIAVNNMVNLMRVYRQRFDTEFHSPEDFEERNIYFLEEGTEMLDKVFNKILSE